MRDQASIHTPSPFTRDQARDVVCQCFTEVANPSRKLEPYRSTSLNSAWRAFRSGDTLLNGPEAIKKNVPQHVAWHVF
jgi:hypothetical protein